MARRNLRPPQRDQMAVLVRIAAHLRAVLTAHVALQLVARRRPSCRERQSSWGALRGSRNGIERAAHYRRWLRRPFVAERARVLRLTGEPVGLLRASASLLCCAPTTGLGQRSAHNRRSQAAEQVTDLKAANPDTCGILSLRRVGRSSTPECCRLRSRAVNATATAGTAMCMTPGGKRLRLYVEWKLS